MKINCDYFVFVRMILICFFSPKNGKENENST